MNAYTGLAGSYDGLTADVDYESWLRWYLRWFQKEKEPVETVLDLACGTGTLTCLLAKEGYDLIGADASPDMLAQAMDKALELEEEQRPLLLCQSMDRLALYSGVDAVVCSLVSLNYLTDKRALKRTIVGVSKYLRPGGLFLFDVIPAWEFARRDGQTFVDEDEDTLCLWRASYEKRTQTITYGLDLFERDGDDRWLRSQEEHRERGWDLEFLKELLTEQGFGEIKVYGADRKKTPDEQDERVFFVCRKS